jgi:hypothetical protein
MAAPAKRVFVVVLVQVAARSQSRQVHLLNCRGDVRRGNAGFGGAGGNRTLGDVEAHPTVGGERRLAATRPDAFLPDLATSLNNIGAISVRLGGKIRLGSGAALLSA